MSFHSDCKICISASAVPTAHHGAWPTDRSKEREVPYHIILRGTAMLDDPEGGPSQRLSTGDIVLLAHGAAHILRDGSSAPPAPTSERKNFNLTISENTGTSDRLEMLCVHFVLTAPHDRLVRAGSPDITKGPPSTSPLLAGLVALMRAESEADNLGRTLRNDTRGPVAHGAGASSGFPL